MGAGGWNPDELCRDGLGRRVPRSGNRGRDLDSEAEAFCTVLPVRRPDCPVPSVPRLHRVMTPARLPKRYRLAR